MKHTLKITILLVGIFLIAQIIGIFVVSKYYNAEIVDGKRVEKLGELPYSLEYPVFQKETSYIPIMILIVIATLFALLLIKINATFLWKLWFILTVWITCTIAFKPFVGEIPAGGIAIVLALLKVFKRNVITHNLPELFMYSGLAVIFFNVFSIVSIIILLLLISVYDMIAVWKTGHMIKLAKFQAGLKVFAGLMIPYKSEYSAKSRKKAKEPASVVNMAILGGGDIGFPMIFSAVLFKTYGFNSLIVSLFAGLGLLVLLFISKKKKFYPAMPFITAGCLVGFAILGLFF